MTTVRDQAIEAGARALGGANYANRGDGGTLIAARAAAVVDAVEPIIRADEREAAHAEIVLRGRGVYAELLREREAEVRERLRAQVEALGVTTVFNGKATPHFIRRDDVLALLAASRSRHPAGRQS